MRLRAEERVLLKLLEGGLEVRATARSSGCAHTRQCAAAPPVWLYQRPLTRLPATAAMTSGRVRRMVVGVPEWEGERWGGAMTAGVAGERVHGQRGRGAGLLVAHVQGGGDPAGARRRLPPPRRPPRRRRLQGAPNKAHQSTASAEAPPTPLLSCAVHAGGFKARPAPPTCRPPSPSPASHRRRTAPFWFGRGHLRPRAAWVGVSVGRAGPGGAGAAAG
jgi:hypothetical protein